MKEADRRAREYPSATPVEDLGRQQPDEDLVRAKQLLDAHVDNSPLAAIEFDPQFRVVRWAASAERMFGYAASEVLGKRITDLRWVYEEDAELVRRESARLLDGSKKRGVNVNRNYRKDGSVIWCEWYSSAIHGADGALVSVLSLVLDITERKRAEEQASQELENTHMLLHSAHALASGRSLPDVLDALCRAVMNALPRVRVTVSLWHEELRGIVTAASKGRPPIPLGQTILLEDMTGPGRRILENRESEIIDYDAVAPSAAARIGRVPAHVALGVPLVYAGRLVGLLTIDDPVERREFTEREVEIAEGIASQASVAVENARLFEDERERARLNEALTEVDRAVHGSLEWEEVADRALVEGASAIGAETACIFGAERGGWVVRSDYGFDPSLTGRCFAEDEIDHETLAAITSHTVTMDDAMSHAPVDATVVAGLGVKSAITAPLVVRGETIAVLDYNYNTQSHHFTGNEVTFVSSVASALALALENARLYDAERSISNRLQEALMTLPDQMQGVEFAHAYHSATEAARVGGDFYDLFDVGDGLVGITVGDVAGKGLDAAVLTSLAKNTIRAYAIARAKTPAEILALTSEVVFQATPAESFVTVFFGLLDRGDGRLVYASAGHTTGAIARAHAAVTALPATGPLLGALELVDFGQAEERLERGDLLFLYTDGLTEARSDGELYGEDRVFDLLADTEREPLAVVRRVVEGVLVYAGGGLSDDMALLAVKLLCQEAETPSRRKLEL